MILTGIIVGDHKKSNNNQNTTHSPLPANSKAGEEVWGTTHTNKGEELPPLPLFN